jgi:hypothetical protein
LHSWFTGKDDVMDALGIFFLLIFFLFLAGWIGGLLWFGRRCEYRIREWADKNGYALLKLEYRRVLGGIFYFLGGFMRSGNWHITVQDDQGGQRRGWVHFGPFFWVDLPWGKMRIRWE